MEINQGDINKNYAESNLKKELYTSSKFISDEMSSLDTNKDIIKYIHDNISLGLTDSDEIYDIFKKIISKNYIIKNIVEYEFNNYTPDIKLSNMDDIIKLCLTDISKYQNVIGGFDLEDNEWIFSDEIEFKRFDLKPNQKLIYNTLSQNNRNKENHYFIKKFVKYIKRHIDPESRINIYHKLIDDNVNEICWVVIVFEKLIDYLD
jgi:hypothetical protein